MDFLLFSSFLEASGDSYLLIPELVTIAARGGTFGWLKKGLFLVLGVYEVLDFMFEADTSIYGMSNGLVEVSVAVWAQWFYID